jgi:hypothetical protein
LLGTGGAAAQMNRFQTEDFSEQAWYSCRRRCPTVRMRKP